MTVPEPSPAYTQAPQDSMDRLQKAISSMEERGMQQDPRFNHLMSIANRHKMSAGSTPSPQPPNLQQDSNHQQQGSGMMGFAFIVPPLIWSILVFLKGLICSISFINDT